jgi:hypothetical protein
MRYKLHPEHQVIALKGLTLQHHAHHEDFSGELRIRWPVKMRFAFSAELMPKRRGVPDFYRRFG